MGEYVLNMEQIAKLCHEVNRAYCRALGDMSQPTWDEAPQWQRDSAIDGVDFHRMHSDAGPEASHENWLKQKVADGWRYGLVKDPAKKEHPCVRPFTDLPREQQIKDHLFQAIVHACDSL